MGGPGVLGAGGPGVVGVGGRRRGEEMSEYKTVEEYLLTKVGMREAMAWRIALEQSGNAWFAERYAANTKKLFEAALGQAQAILNMCEPEESRLSSRPFFEMKLPEPEHAFGSPNKEALPPDESEPFVERVIAVWSNHHGGFWAMAATAVSTLADLSVEVRASMTVTRYAQWLKDKGIDYRYETLCESSLDSRMIRTMECTAATGWTAKEVE